MKSDTQKRIVDYQKEIAAAEKDVQVAENKLTKSKEKFEKALEYRAKYGFVCIVNMMCHLYLRHCCFLSVGGVCACFTLPVLIN